MALAGAVVACAGRTGDFYDGKRQAAAYFFRWELPRTRAQFDLLASGDDTTLAHARRLVLRLDGTRFGGLRTAACKVSSRS